MDLQEVLKNAPVNIEYLFPFLYINYTHHFVLFLITVCVPNKQDTGANYPKAAIC